jgi:hypothetical protein
MDESKQCGAALRRKPGQFCRRAVGLFPNGRCNLHGGKNLRGIAHPNFTVGETSKYMVPLRMRADYETALSDPKLLELKADIAAVQSRAQDLIKRVDTGESGHLWKMLRKAYTDLQDAKDKAAQLVALSELGALINRGSADYHAWEEFGKQVDRKQRLVESERKRAIELQQTVTLDRLNPLMVAIINYVRRRITERDGLIEFQSILETHAGVAAVSRPAVDGIVVGREGSGAEQAEDSST